jgi:hypothetical protein
MKKFLFFLLTVLSSSIVSGQTATPMDTVYLMSGRTVAGVVKDSTNEGQLKILIPRKGNFKADFVDLDLVYSVKYSNGSEKVFYKQDTLFGNYFTAQEVKYFMAGERDAWHYYRCPVWVAGAFAAGFAGGASGRFIVTLLPPFAYALGTSFFRTKIKPGTVSNPEYLKYDTYLFGYEKEAKKRRVMRSLLWGGIGMVAGVTSIAIYNQAQPH